MSYAQLIEILLSDDVYHKLKQNEQEIFRLIPELEECKGFNQNNKWHIYDVYEHILHVVAGVESNIYLRLSALFHDVGKPLVYTEDANGIGHFYGHWNKSIEIFRKYQDQFGISSLEKKLVENLIFYHDINVGKMTNDDIDNMINNIGLSNVRLLFALKKADLLAQAPEFHNQLININNQEKYIVKIKTLIHH